MIVIGNGRLVSRDETHPYYENGAVAVEGEVIVKVGNFEDLRKKYPDAEFADAKGKVIMPALINTHEHIYSAMARWQRKELRKRIGK